MAEVDENLNYLIGRLSLVTQEFNQIKLGLGDALDNIKSSFLTVQAKIKGTKVMQYCLQNITYKSILTMLCNKNVFLLLQRQDPDLITFLALS